MSKIEKHLKNAIKVATRELCCGDQPLRERLGAAILSLDGFLGKREAWPAALYIRAQDISDALKADNASELAIESMDFPQVQRLAERILNLYADCHSASPSDSGG